MSKYTDDDLLKDRTSDVQKERQIKRQKRREEIKEQTEIAKQARKRRVGAVIRFTCFIAISAALIFTGISTMNIFSLMEEKRDVEAQLAELQHKKEGLEQELDLVESDEYVEQQARSELRMIYDGEVLYVVKDENSEEKTDEPGEDEILTVKPQ